MNDKKINRKFSCFPRFARKKGISAIIATVLIILITVAAVAIVWTAVIPMIRDQLGSSQACFDASAALMVTQDYSCVDSDMNTVNVQIHRAPGNFELVGLDIIVSSQGSTKAYNQTNVPDVNGDRVYIINYSSAEFAAAVDEVSVAAIVKTGSTHTICDSSGAITVSKCA